jgi:hypothetical protein
MTAKCCEAIKAFTRFKGCMSIPVTKSNDEAVPENMRGKACVRASLRQNLYFFKILCNCLAVLKPQREAMYSMV